MQLSLAAGLLCVVLALASTSVLPASAHLRDPPPAAHPAAAPTLAPAMPAMDAPGAMGAVRQQDLSPEAARLLNASIPISSAANPAARPFRLAADGVLDEARATDCMTAAVYYEAGYESLDGQRAVAQVVLNRLRNPLFPKTVCGVVFERSERSGCQFTFTCDGALARKPAADAWEGARKVAIAALHGYVMRKVGEATYYHADYVAPAWSPGLVKAAVVGRHIFYRATGELGLPPAFRGRYAGSETKDLEIAALDALPPGPDRLTTRPGDVVATTQAPPAPVVEPAPVQPAAAAASAGDQMVDASAAVAAAGPILKPEELDWQGRPRAKGPPRLARPDSSSGAF